MNNYLIKLKIAKPNRMKVFSNIKKCNSRWLSLLSLLLVAHYATAGIETSIASVQSPNLSSLSVIRVQDNKYDFMKANTGTWENSFHNKKSINRVIFRVDQRNLRYQSAAYKIKATVAITAISWNSTTDAFQSTTFNKDLVVEHLMLGDPVNDKAVYEFTGASVVEVKVTGLVPLVGSLATANLSLEAEIETERYYPFDPLAIPTNFSHRSTELTATGELEVFWGFILGAESYDLEWTYINNYNTGVEIAPQDLPVDSRHFQFNSTRINTSENYYRIPYIYGKGYILYRIRAIGRTNKDNYAADKPGAWSTDNYTWTTVAAFPKKFPGAGESLQSHNDNLNWQFSATYAEEGKSKAVVNYFDGSLRNRQSVTKSKTNKEAIVGESIYDYEGRPAIQVLPVPSKSAKIQFHPNFNQNESKVPYSKKDFDEDISLETCALRTPPMRSDTTVDVPNKGASNYYSSWNRDQAGHQAYLPDAQKYPFTQTEYTQDNTGRIRAQGGVGKMMQLGEKPTRYFYATPEQDELDRLFGSEAGDAMHYKKNMVRDANGQLSISYLDQQERVVATCLAGVNPLPTVALDGAEVKTLRTDLFGKVKPTDFSGSRNELDKASRSLVLNKRFTPEVKGYGYFSYEVRGQKFQDVCPLVGDPVCYDCIFDLRIELKDECGKQYLNGVGVNGGDVTAPVTINSPFTTPSSCEASPPAFHQGDLVNDDWTTSSELDPEKSYELTKTLVLNQQALDTYTDHYINNSCLIAYDVFLNNQLDSIDKSGCNITCQDCIDDLGTYDQYNVHVNPACAPCMTYDEWKALEKQCNEMCENKSVVCEAGYNAMLSDVGLYGQYGQVVPGIGVLNGSIVNADPAAYAPEQFPLSVFNASNSLPRKWAINQEYATASKKNSNWAPSWRFPYDPAQTLQDDRRFTYLNENGEIARVEVKEPTPDVFQPDIVSEDFIETIEGKKFVRPQFLKNFSDFAEAWNPSWAVALVRYHPEYEYYRFCIDISPSHDFDAELQAVDKVSDMKAAWILLNSANDETHRKKYMNPVSSGLDPYFTIANPNYSEAEKAAMSYSMLHYQGGRTIWEVVYVTNHCPNSNGVMLNCAPCSYDYFQTTTPPADFDNADWVLFKSLYLSLKQRIQQQRATKYAIENGGYNGCIGSETFDPFRNHFYQSQQSASGSPFSSAPFNMVFMKSQYFNFEQPCNWARFALYKEKQSRFPAVNDLLNLQSLNDEYCFLDMPMGTDDLGGNYEAVDCPDKTAAILEESKDLANRALYEQCGQCPSAHLLEVFLNGMAGEDKLTSTSTPLSCNSGNPAYPFFTEDLAKLLLGTGTPPTQFSYNSTHSATNPSSLNISFVVGETPKCSVQLKFTNLATESTPVPTDLDLDALNYSFADVVRICCVKHITDPLWFTYQTNRNFRMTVTVKVKEGDPYYDPRVTTDPTKVMYRDFIVEGVTTCFNVGGCTFDPICKANEQAVQLQALLNSLWYESSTVSQAFNTTTATLLTSLPQVKPLYENLQPALNREVLNGDANTDLKWKFKLASSASVPMQFILEFTPDPVVLPGTVCSLTVTGNESFAPEDIIRFTSIKPKQSKGYFTIKALVKNTSGDPTYKELQAYMPCLNFGDCQRFPSAMQNGGTKTTAGEIGSYACQASEDALALQSLLINEYINGSANFGCTDGKLSYTVGSLGAFCREENTGFLYFPKGSEFGYCGTASGYYNYQDIMNFSGIAPDPEYTVAGKPNHNFIIYAHFPNGEKVQMKGYLACLITGNCYPVNGDCSWTENLVKNGTFEQALDNFPDVTSDYDPVDPANLESGYNLFCIVKDASVVSNDFKGKDHTSGHGNFVLARANGVGEVIWKQSNITIQKNTNYRFSAWLSRSTLNQSLLAGPGQFTLSIHGNVSGPVTSPEVSYPSQWLIWEQVEFNWFSGENTTVTLEIKNTNFPGSEIYFLYGLDDIAFEACHPPVTCEITKTPVLDEIPNPCLTQLIQLATSNAQQKYKAYVEGMRQQFQENYIQKCLSVYEDFHMKYEDTQHHFTLYYYDQAGNLVRTIPPEGVLKVTDRYPGEVGDITPRVQADMAAIKLDRKEHTHTVFTQHTMATTYTYNSLNQLVAQTSPDVNDMDIWKSSAINTGIPSGHTVTNTAFSDAANGTTFTIDGSGKGHLYVTGNGGGTWTELTSIGISDLLDVKYATSSIAYAVGRNGLVMKSADGGSSWKVIPVPAVTDLIHCDFSSATNGLVYDNKGGQWQTTDGGVLWNVISNDLSGLLGNELITSIATGNSAFVAVTTAGHIFKSGDGVDWEPAASIRTVSLNKVCNAGNRYYAIGDNGRLLKSTDDGVNWNVMENNFEGDLDKMVFNYPFQGWVIDAAGKLKQMGGTETWTDVSIPGTSSPVFVNVSFSGNEAYAVTANGSYSVYNGSTWSALNTTSAGSAISHIAGIAPMGNTDNLVMANSSGQIYRKDGSGWSLKLNTGVMISDLHVGLSGGTFIGAALSNGKIYSFTNSASAEKLNGYSGMWFSDGVHGFALSTDGTTLATTSDGGQNWSTAASGLGVANLRSLAVKADATGAVLSMVAVGDNGAIWKKNGGGWSNVTDHVQMPALNAVTIEDGNTAYIAGRDGVVLKTSNLTTSAPSWQEQVTNTSSNLNAIDFNGSTGLAAGSSAQVIYTSNAGSSWTASTHGTNDLRAVLAGTNLYAAGANGASYQYTGSAWSAINGADATLYSLAVNSGNLIGVGANGKIVKTSGSTWTNVNTFEPPILHDLKLLGSRGIAVGKGGSVITSDNTGKTWSARNTGVHDDLNAVHVMEEANGQALAVGNNGRALTTTDWGVNWIEETILQDEAAGTQLNDVHYAGTTGVVAGNTGKVIMITGGNWHDHNSTATGVSANLHAAYVVDKTLAFAAGANGTVLKIAIAANGTPTFTSVTISGNPNLKGIYFRDRVTGYVTGSNGAFFKTTDGGQSWQTQNSNASSPNYNDLTVIDNHQLILSGDSKSINHIKDMRNEYGSVFWYDALGRLVVSQNAKQYSKTPDHMTYSYTKYDGLGRIEEVGEIHAAAFDPDPLMIGTGPIEMQYVNGKLDLDRYSAWLNNSARREVTTTVYDEGEVWQENLLKRVAKTYMDEDGNASPGYDHATYYSYDAHGNVKRLIQENTVLGDDSRKKIDYEYDLISGNVKQVSYQDGEADAFYHKYLYDADNRITHVFTSKDKSIWEEDAKYFYYKHGPLSRTELGDEKVQAIDYAYTLQGWIKGVNSTNLAAANDIGKDAESSNTSNKYVSKDVYGYNLNYYLDKVNTSVTNFEGDYKPINASAGNFIASISGATYINTTQSNLYNGNISSMSTTITESGDAVKPQLTAYKYDQLNRIKEMKAYSDASVVSSNSWAGATNADHRYESSMIYDKNGNIVEMTANGQAGNINRDKLHYTYENTTNSTRATNRLKQVEDDYTTADLTDIESQSANNYSYDEIGNLKGDLSEEIGEIEWNVYGKIKSIERTSGSTKPRLDFVYDAAGNRISKKVTSTTDVTTTYYVRDASGNVLSTYRKEGTNALHLKEQSIYGSSRVGLQYRNVDMSGTPESGMYTREWGSKEYELSNHLGNVLSTVSDTRVAQSSGGVTTDGFKSKLLSSQDYYAFGAVMPGRGLNSSLNYRYGFNGKENDNEVKGNGNQQDYGLRIYDPRLGRFLSVDPLAGSFAWNSPYCFAENSPIWGIDLDGGEFKTTVDQFKKAAQELKKETYKQIEQKANAAASTALIKTAKTIYPDVDKANEATKQTQFKSNPDNSVAILLYEFATGTGKDNRTFNYGGKESFANSFIEGRVLSEVSSDFANAIKSKTYSEFQKEGAKFGLEFSPDHVGLQESVEKHMDSNLSQFFVGGANVSVSATKDANWVNVSITNSTSRNSLMLHQGENYPRDGKDEGTEKPLSTIKQTFTFRMKIDPSQFKEEKKK